MKIVAVSTWFPNAKSPSAGTFVEKDVHLLARDHDVKVVHLVSPELDDGGPRVIVRDGITVRRIVMSTQRPDHIVRASHELSPLLKEADLVHTMAFSTLLPFALGRPRAPWVHTEHWSGLTNPSTLARSWQLALPTLKRLLAKPDVVTAVCEYLARPIRQVRGGGITVVPCLVPSPSLLRPRPAREDRLRLAAIGGLIDRKDPLLAVDTLAALREKGMRAHLTWVGDGPLRDQVVARSAQLGVADDVRLAGVLGTEGVSNALGEADMFFLPTRADNFCVSAAEALVHGRPVVVGSTGGQGEYIRPEVGSLVDVQDAGLYAEAIIETEARTRSLGADEIAATIGDRFSPDAVRKGYLETYDLALERFGRRTRG